jgi:hypothetical protein
MFFDQITQITSCVIVSPSLLQMDSWFGTKNTMSAMVDLLQQVQNIQTKPL